VTEEEIAVKFTARGATSSAKISEEVAELYYEY
jgi:hypothetical protein